MQNLIDQLKTASNSLIVVLIPLIGAAFYAVTDQELSSGAIASIVVMLLTLALSLGIEDMIALARAKFKPSIIEPLWKSKRVWTTAGGILLVLLNKHYPIEFETEIDGATVNFYTGIVAYIFAAISAFSIGDFTEAWKAPAETGVTQTIQHQVNFEGANLAAMDFENRASRNQAKG